MATEEFDPVDLVMLAMHHQGNLSITKAERLVDVARMLHKLWLGQDQEEWNGVWAYDIADPLGWWLSVNPDADDSEVENHARWLVEETIAEYSTGGLE